MIHFEVVLLLCFFLLLLWRRGRGRGVSLLLLESLLVTMTLFGILLDEFWQGRVWEAKKVCVIECCVWLFGKIELMWKGIRDWPSKGRYQSLVL